MAARSRSRTPPRREWTLAEATRRLDAALQARQAFLSDDTTTAWRAFHGAADGVDGLIVEKFAEVLVAQVHEGALGLSEPLARELCERLRVRLAAQAVYRKWFARDRAAARRADDASDRDATPWLGAPVAPEVGVLEHGMRLLIRPYDGFSVGLFLENRDNRTRVRRLARGRRVLNTFAYTCGFSVAAALGGAAETVSVDISRKFLEWGKRNFAANGLPLDEHRFICSDVFDYYRRAARQGRSFDLIILDPPTFARTRRPQRVFELERDLNRLCAGAVSLLVPGGLLLLSVNHQKTMQAQLERAAVTAAGRRRVTVVERPPLPADFAGDAVYAKSVLLRVE